MKKEDLVAIINYLQDAIMGVQESMNYCPICDKYFDEDVDPADFEHTPECDALSDRIEEAQGDA